MLTGTAALDFYLEENAVCSAVIEVAPIADFSAYSSALPHPHHLPLARQMEPARIDVLYRVWLPWEIFKERNLSQSVIASVLLPLV